MKSKFFHQTVSYVICYLFLFYDFFLGALTKKLIYEKLSPIFIRTPVTTKVYCKTDHFPFEVISFPFLESNIDNGLCYRVFYSQVIRFQRLCSNRCDFETRTNHLGIVLKGRGYTISRLEKEFCKAVRKYISEFQKWSLPILSLIHI